MTISEAQARTLREIAEHGFAVRCPGTHSPLDYTWRVGGVPRTYNVHRLFSAGLVQMAGPDTAELTARGWEAIGGQR